MTKTQFDQIDYSMYLTMSNVFLKHCKKMLGP